ARRWCRTAAHPGGGRRAASGFGGRPARSPPRDARRASPGPPRGQTAAGRGRTSAVAAPTRGPAVGAPVGGGSVPAGTAPRAWASMVSSVVVTDLAAVVGRDRAVAGCSGRTQRQQGQVQSTFVVRLHDHGRL